MIRYEIRLNLIKTVVIKFNYAYQQKNHRKEKIKKRKKRRGEEEKKYIELHWLCPLPLAGLLRVGSFHIVDNQN